MPLADHIGESLEADIRDFRYAYARDAAQRLIAPPPKSVPIESLPPEVVALFEQAFTERGVESRPTAQQWVGALDTLRAQLQACAKNSLHVHAGVTGECVWCGLDRRHLVFFGTTDRGAKSLSASAAVARTSVDLDLAAMEAKVAAITLPKPLHAPSLDALALPPCDEEIESSALGRGLIFGLPSAALGAATAIHALATPAVLGMTMLGAGLPIAAIAGFISWRVLARRADDYREASRTFRLLHDTVSDRVEEINEAAGVGLIDDWRKAERRLREFRAKEASALTTFKLDASEAGLRTFLRSQLLERWRDPRVSLAERIRLRAAGIETAADFDKARLAKLHLLGDDARAVLLSWKQGLIVEYRRKTPAATPELAEFMAWRSKQQRELEERLLEAFEKLQKRQQPGSLVLQARLNQLADLVRDLHAQYQKCLKLAAKLPKFDNAGPQRN